MASPTGVNCKTAGQSEWTPLSAGDGRTGHLAGHALYNWRRGYGGMYAYAAKELKELREQNIRLKRLPADA